MAINYTDLFTNLGVLVKASNVLAGFTTNLETEKTNILDQLNATNKYSIMDGTTSTWDSYKSTVLSWISSPTSQAFQLFSDQTAVVDQLNLGQNSGFSTVFPALYADMVTNDKNVTANSVTLGSVTKTTSYANAGTALLDKTLDGVTSPASGFSAYRSYNGLESQISLDDSVTLKCVVDSENQTISPGAEVFSWVGSKISNGASPTGAGNGPNIQPLGVQSFLRNLDMDTFSTNSPGSFTINNGTAGTHIFKDITGQYEGNSGLKFTGDGVQANIQISQAISTSQLVPLKRYAFVCHLKGETGTSAGTFTIQFEGTGYTAGASEKISLNAATLAGLTSWTRYAFYINMPAEIPDDLKLVIKWTGTPSAHSVRFDNGAFGLPTYWNGFNVVIYKGSSKFLYGDTLKFDISNSEAGVFQTHARDYLKIQWPTDATPTISDTLAQ